MKTGILGGTFDPIHKGHMAIAHRALEYFELDSVVLMVAHVPPHKQGHGIANSCHRFAMAVLETEGDPRFGVSDWELQRAGPSYTSHTLEKWRMTYPETDLCFIAGVDSLSELHLWRDCAKLLSEYCFVFVQRPGIKADLERLAPPADLRKRLTLIQGGDPRPAIKPGRSFLLSSHHQPVSSTQIRHALLQQRPVGADLLSPRVLEHIRKYRLYERRNSEVS